MYVWLYITPDGARNVHREKRKYAYIGVLSQRVLASRTLYLHQTKFRRVGATQWAFSTHPRSVSQAHSFKLTSASFLSVETSALPTLPKPDTLALTPHEVLDAWAILMPPFSVVLVKVEAMDCSVECKTEASKLAEAPALIVH